MIASAFLGRLAKRYTSAELDGWMVKLEVADPTTAESLMDQTAYKAFLKRLPV
jgi:glycine cleavage system H lipoate-binding protein